MWFVLDKQSMTWSGNLQHEILEIFVDAQRSAADRRRRVRLETHAPTFELRANYVVHGLTKFLPGCNYNTAEIELLRALVREQRLSRAGARVARSRTKCTVAARRLEKRGLLRIEQRRPPNRVKPFNYVLFTEFGIRELIRVFELELASDYQIEA